MRDRNEATARHDAFPVGYRLHQYRIEAVLGASHFWFVYKAMAQVSHPGVVRLRDFFEANGTAYIMRPSNSFRSRARVIAGRGRLD